MKHWADAEMTLVGDDVECGSQHAIFNSEDEFPLKYGVSRLWDRLRSKDSNPDMSITRTSEVHLRNEPASGPSSRRSSGHPRTREERDAQLPPPLPRKP